MNMNRCGVCGREQYKVDGGPILKIGEQKIQIQGYNIDIMTFMSGVNICEDCMDIHCKIKAIEQGINFSRAGVHYFADGRNLKGEPYTEEEFESKTYYTIEPIFKEVSKEEFDKFVDEYPNKLKSDCCGISDPPLVTLNDFTLANHWPQSVVAKYDAGEPNDYYGIDYKRTYKIMSNQKEVLESICV